MNTQQYDKLKTCLSIISLSVAVGIVYMLAVIPVVIVVTITGIVGKNFFTFILVNKLFGFAAKEWQIVADIRGLEIANLLTELLVAIWIIKALLYYHRWQGWSYQPMVKVRKWDRTTYLYMAFVIVSFTAILFLYKGHLLYSSLDQEFTPRELALFPPERLFWSKVHWIIVVPMHTEIVYRGFVFRRCRQNEFSPLSTILLSAASFALVYTPFYIKYGDITLQYIYIVTPHIWQWYTYKFVLGYTLATVYARTQSIELTIMLSSLHNFLMCFFDLSEVSSGVMLSQVLPMLLMLGIQYIICYRMKFPRRMLFGRRSKADPAPTVARSQD